MAMILDILTSIPLDQIIGIASGGGSALMALIGLGIRVLWRSIKGTRYQRAKESLKRIEERIEEKNPEGKDELKRKLTELINSL